VRCQKSDVLERRKLERKHFENILKHSTRQFVLIVSNSLVPTSRVTAETASAKERKKAITIPTSSSMLQNFWPENGFSPLEF
jgi:hypothetical protein